MLGQSRLNKTFTTGVAVASLLAAVSLGTATANDQTTGSKKMSMTQQEMKAAERGWSVKKNFLDQAVYNDNNEKIGNIDDLVMTRNNPALIAVIGAGGFLGVGKHDVAIPVSRLKHEGDKLVLPGASKEALKAMPEFQYTSADRTDNRSSKR
jgi:sporulation protein YlmC with PRC-barrel domain